MKIHVLTLKNPNKMFWFKKKRLEKLWGEFDWL